GGFIDLAGTTSVTGTNGFGRLRFLAETNGSIRFGDLNTSARTAIEADGGQSIIEVLGDVNLSPSTQLFITNSGTLKVAGDFVHSLTAEADFNLNTGVIHMNGVG